MTRQERANSHQKQNRIDSIRQSFKDDTSIPSKSIVGLKDNTGGTVSNILVDAAGASYPTDEEYVNSIASLTSKVNEILFALKSVGIVK